MYDKEYREREQQRDKRRKGERERERESTTNEERKYWGKRFRVGSTHKGKILKIFKYLISVNLID